MIFCHVNNSNQKRISMEFVKSFSEKIKCLEEITLKIQKHGGLVCREG